MSTTTHASQAMVINKQGVTKKEFSVKSYSLMKKFTSVFCIALAFVIMNVSSANARILTTLSGTEVIVTKNSDFEPATIIIECGDGTDFQFNYYQRVIINGKTAMVPVEFVYDVGTYPLYLEGQCGGYNLYGVGTCSCFKTDLDVTPDFKNCLPTDVKNTIANTVATRSIENMPQEIAEPVQMPIIAPLAPKPVGFLCVRKNVIRKGSGNMV